MENPLSNPQSVSILLAALLKRLKSIEDKLTHKVAYLSTEEAVGAYRTHLEAGVNRRGRKFTQDSIDNFNYVLEKIQEHFPETNVTEITAEECDIFLNKYWLKANTGSFKQRQTQLRIFFSFCIQYLKKKGNPVFHNPCDLLDPIAVETERPEWFSVEQMRQFIGTAIREHHWLSFSILATSGIRIGDLMNLRKSDVNDRILKLRFPKSQKKEELAIIPSIVAGRLGRYLEGKSQTNKVIPFSEIAIYSAIKTHGKWAELNLSPHSLRKWCASYWERKGEEGMVNFILRHATVNLRGRYVAPLTIEEVMEKQKVLEEELYG